MDTTCNARQKSGKKNYFLLWNKTVWVLMLLVTLQITDKLAVGQNEGMVVPNPDSVFIDTIGHDKDGSPLVKAIIPGSRPRFSGNTKSVNILPPTAIVLDQVPAFTWSFGCTPTAGAMLAGYYDRTGFPNMYTGPANGGVCPLDNSSWGFTEINGAGYAVCPLSASIQGVDGREERGHVDDYWIEYANNEPDPYITNSWSPHEYADCTADYMKTSQSEYENPDGTTTFWFFDNGEKLNMEEDDDGMYGLKLFFESRGYTVEQWFTQTLYGYNGFNNGFTYADYKNEIDEGRPVMMHLTGHTILGIGYDTLSETIYFHDTWDYNTHAMDWGGEYEDMQLFCVSVFKLEQNYVCYAPANSCTVDITKSTAEICWDSVCNVNSYEILYGESGFNINDGTFITADDTNKVRLCSLNPETSYTYCVRSIRQGFYSEWSTPSNFVTEGVQQIELNSGWNIMSFRLMPDSTDLMDIMQPLIDQGMLKKVMDESGNIVEDWGVSGGWHNTIGSLQNSEGYKINVTSAFTLDVEGVQVQFPYDIELKQGWNIISWPSPDEQSGLDVFQTLMSEGMLKKVMDESGNVIENWGVFGGWRNYIGNFKPGEGYKVNVSGSCTLTIEESETKSKWITPVRMASEHFIPAYTGNGVDHMSVNLVNLLESGIMEGDEIGIFDGDVCVGSALITNAFIHDDKISIPASAATDFENKDGYTTGNPVLIKLYRNGSEYALVTEPIGNSKTEFRKGSTLFAQLGLTTEAEDLALAESTEITCYPNPFTEELTIKINLKENADLRVDVMNHLGQIVRNIAAEKQFTNGLHNLKWDGRNSGNQRVSAGIYYVRIAVGDEVTNRKIIVSN